MAQDINVLVRVTGWRNKHDAWKHAIEKLGIQTSAWLDYSFETYEDGSAKAWIFEIPVI